MKFISDFVSLIYPRTCIVCDNVLVRGEDFICISCYSDLPFTKFENMSANPVANIFRGRANFHSCAALLNFESGNPVQKIMHELKYRNNQKIGRFLGTLLGQRLMKSFHFQSVDVIVPVPIHRSKKRRRGYNQSDLIASGLSETMGIPCETGVIKRRVRTESQTRKRRYERWQNVADVFEFIGGRDFPYRHILLIDDVVTTGATAEACYHTVRSHLDVPVSFIALGRSG